MKLFSRSLCTVVCVLTASFAFARADIDNLKDDLDQCPNWTHVNVCVGEVLLDGLALVLDAIGTGSGGGSEGPVKEFGKYSFCSCQGRGNYKYKLVRNVFRGPDAKFEELLQEGIYSSSDCRNLMNGDYKKSCQTEIPEQVEANCSCKGKGNYKHKLVVTSYVGTKSFETVLQEGIYSSNDCRKLRSQYAVCK